MTGASTMSGPATAREMTDVQTASRLRLVIGRLSRQLRRNQVGGLTPSQLSALSSVDRHGPIRLGDLAARERVSPPTLTPVIASLEKLDLVRRRSDPDDRRSALMAVSPRGQHLLEQLRSEYAVDLAQRIATLDHASRRALIAALPVLEQLVEDDPETDH